MIMSLQDVSPYSRAMVAINGTPTGRSSKGFTKRKLEVLAGRQGQPEALKACLRHLVTRAIKAMMKRLWHTHMRDESRCFAGKQTIEQRREKAKSIYRGTKMRRVKSCQPGTHLRCL